MISAHATWHVCHSGILLSRVFFLILMEKSILQLRPEAVTPSVWRWLNSDLWSSSYCTCETVLGMRLARDIPGKSRYLAGWQLTAAGDLDFSGGVLEHRASLSGTVPHLSCPYCCGATYAKLSWMIDQRKLSWPVTADTLGCTARHRLWCCIEMPEVPT